MTVHSIVSWVRTLTIGRRSKRRRSAGRIGAEPLEVRMLLSAARPVAQDDVYSIDTRLVEDDVGSRYFTYSSSFDVLKNDEITLENASFLTSLVITDMPDHGTIKDIESGRVGYFGDSEEVDTVDDEDSPLGDGHASALWGVVDQYGQIRLKVSRYSDVEFDGTGWEQVWGDLIPSGEYALYVRVGKGDFEGFDPRVFDFEFRDDVYPGKIGSHIISGQVPGREFIAWIDNTVGPTHPDTWMLNAGQFEVQYAPDFGFIGTDAFRYALKYPDGTMSPEATVTVTVRNRLPEVSSGEEETYVNVPVGVGWAGDPDGMVDRSSVKVVSQPAHGTLIINDVQPDPGENIPLLIYTPAPGFQGTDVFTYTVQDDRGAVSKRGMIRISVTPPVEVNERPVASDDLVSAALNKPLSIDALANDSDSDGTLDPSSLTIIQPPTHGTAVVRKTAKGVVVIYKPSPNYLGPDEFRYTIKDNDGAVSDAALVTINPPPETYDDAAATLEGTAVVIDVLANDAPSVSGSPLAPSSLAVSDAPKRGRVTFRKTADGVKAVYTPHAGTVSVLVVDDASDRDDGNYSRDHLSLREAIKLANADRFTDSFTYTVRDKLGIRSNVSTVTVNIEPKPTSIQFASRLTSRRPAIIQLSRPGDTVDGNSALAITSNISLAGPVRGNTMTIAGMGRDSDLRLFRVATGGGLTLSNLKIAKAGSDGSGGAITVESGATASLTNCVLTDNYAFFQGGAISSFGTTSLTNCRIAGNDAEQGGGISSFGTLKVSGSTFSGNQAEYGGAIHIGMGLATLSNVSLANNTAQVSGGGIFIGGTLQATNIQLTNNRAQQGGGFFTVGEATLTDSAISGNTADTGGGFEVGSGVPTIRPAGQRAGVVTLTRTVVSHNRARQGGGFRNVGRVVASESTIASNHAQQGGGVYNTEFGMHQSSELTLTNSTLARNKADLGGGVYVDQGTITLNNATVGSNSAHRGGGLYLHSGGGTLLGTTISDNTASQGAGIDGDFGRVTLTSSIVADNRGIGRPSDIAGSMAVNVAASFHNLIGLGGSGGLKNGQQGNIVGADPLLGKLANYGGRVDTFPLLPGSPAINAGTGSTVDARGVAAVGPRDIGAFESRGFRLTLKGGSGQSARLGKRFVKPLLVEVTALNRQEPVVGGVVAFSSPATGPTATLNPQAGVIGSDRRASTRAKATRDVGKYRVLATAAGVRIPVIFSLTNTGTRPRMSTVASQAATMIKVAIPTPTALKSAPAPANSLDWTAGYAVMPADRTEYSLNNRHQLLRRIPGGRWEVLEKDVLSYQQTRNGDLYLLNDKRELKRLQLGYSWSIVQSGVQSFRIDAFGTVFVQDSLNFVTMHSAFERYYVLPEIPDGTQHFAMDPPSDFSIVHAMGMETKWGTGQGRWELPGSFLLNDVQWFFDKPDFPLTDDLRQILGDSGLPVPDSFPGPQNKPEREFDTSYYSNVRIVKLPIVDRIDAPRAFPGVGWAQLHHAQYQVNIYSATLRANATDRGPWGFARQIDRIYISHDHLHLVDAGTRSDVVATSTPSTNLAESDSAPLLLSHPKNGSNVSDFLESQGAQNSGRMITAPDGTIYKPGHGQSDLPMTGNEATPYFLWKLPPNGLWKPLDFVLAHAVGPDSRLYILDAKNALKTPALGPSKWATLAKDVRSFVLDKDGNLVVLGANGDLRTLNARTKQWSAPEAGVASLMINPLGKIYTVTNGKELRVRAAGVHWSVVERGVRDFGMVDDGTFYALNGRGHVVRIAPNGLARVLTRGAQALQVAPDGGVHVLTMNKELMKLTARDHWTVLDTDVRTFQIAANGDLYLINTQNELRRQKFGFSWSTLQSDVVSFTIHSGGTIYAYDRQQVPTLYASWGRTVTLNPVLPGSVPLAPVPTDWEGIRSAANLPFWIDQSVLSPENNNEDLEYNEWWPSQEQIIEGSEGIFASILSPQSQNSNPRLRYSSVEYPKAKLTTVLNMSTQTERLVDQIEPARFVPGLGSAQLHRAQFKSTITWNTADELQPDGSWGDGSTTRKLVIYIDRDHFHFVW
jgi:hypothetical protein